MIDLKPTLAKLADGAALSEADAEAAFEAIMSGNTSPAQIAAFLMAMRVRGESVDVLTGAARIMRANALKVTAPADAIERLRAAADDITAVGRIADLTFIDGTQLTVEVALAPAP